MPFSGVNKLPQGSLRSRDTDGEGEWRQVNENLHVRNLRNLSIFSLLVSRMLLWNEECDPVRLVAEFAALPSLLLVSNFRLNRFQAEESEVLLVWVVLSWRPRRDRMSCAINTCL